MKSSPIGDGVIRDALAGRFAGLAITALFLAYNFLSRMLRRCLSNLDPHLHHGAGDFSENLEYD